MKKEHLIFPLSMEERMKKMDEEFKKGMDDEMERRKSRGITGIDLAEKETFNFKIWRLKFLFEWKKELKEVTRRQGEVEKEHV
jgi:hypothetical protein